MHYLYPLQFQEPLISQELRDRIMFHIGFRWRGLSVLFITKIRVHSVSLQRPRGQWGPLSWTNWICLCSICAIQVSRVSKVYRCKLTLTLLLGSQFFRLNQVTGTPVFCTWYPDCLAEDLNLEGKRIIQSRYKIKKPLLWSQFCISEKAPEPT